MKAINKAANEEEPKEAPKTAAVLPEVDYISALQSKMTSKLGRRINIYNKGKNKKIEIHYNGNDDLNHIIKLLCGENVFDEL